MYAGDSDLAKGMNCWRRSPGEPVVDAESGPENAVLMPDHPARTFADLQVRRAGSISVEQDLFDFDDDLDAAA